MNTIFKTQKKENTISKIKRITFNFFPAYRRTGGRICFISEDYKEVHVRLSHNWLTRNYVGSIFGGSIYGALDPVYMIQLLNILGKDYVVWDKSATIKFIKPIKTTVYARFLISEDVINEIQSEVKKNQKYTLELSTCFEDNEGKVYAEVNKTIYIADKAYYKSQKGKSD